jgi:hypothetical protein
LRDALNLIPDHSGAFQTTYKKPFFGIADALVTKLNPPGSGLVYSTYLGVARGFAISVDSSGYVRVFVKAFRPRRALGFGRP